MKPTARSIPVLALALALGACSPGARDAGSVAETSNVVTITTQGLTFGAPDRIPSGWITFRFKNESDMTHFAVLERLPDGVGIEEHRRDVAAVFQKGMDLLNQGKKDEAIAAFGALPKWFGPQIFAGGVGFLSEGVTGETTVHVEPGTYVIECYVKTAGIFHSYSADPKKPAMVHQFVVTASHADAPEPTPTLSVSISSDRGIELEGEPSAGPQTVAVHFADQMVHENFLQHDVHLARLDDGADLDELAAWMNWMNPDGLEVPAPDGVQFLGGVHEMPAGETGYFTVTLKPGRYAWISEVPNQAAKGLLKTFTVPGAPS